jgi:prophage antirepressor-like protein
MDILKVFSLCDDAHSINIQGTVEEPLFQANQIAKLLGMKTVNKQIMDWDTTLKVITESKSPGGIQKTTFLTEIGLYRLIGRSNKPIAEKFQIWVCKTIKDIRLTGQYQLQKQNEIDRKLIQLQEKEKTHKKLVELFHLKNVIYICKMKELEDGKFIIKIGSSQDIKQRISQLPIEYDVVPLLLDVFNCVSHVRLERNIHNNTSMKSLRHQIKKKDSTLSRETYIVNEDEYNIVIQIVKKELKRISTEEDAGKAIDLESKKLDFETKKIELEIMNKKMEFEKQQNQEQIEDHIQEPEQEPNQDSYPEIPVPISFIRKRSTPRSPKVYQYNPETNEIVQIYDNIITVLRTIEGSSITPLKSAVKNNAIYKGFRWLFVNRDVTEDPILPPTIETKHQEVRLVAMIDIKQTKIMEVFDCQKNAAIARNLEGFSTISRSIKTGRISSGHYWKWYEDCSPEMKQEFLSHNTLPEKHINKNSSQVIQMHPLTNEELHTYPSITDVLLKFQLSRATLKKVSDNNEVYNGFKWRIV